jgi:hypothetical protein
LTTAPAGRFGWSLDRRAHDAGRARCDWTANLGPLSIVMLVEGGASTRDR